MLEVNDLRSLVSMEVWSRKIQWQVLTKLVWRQMTRQVEDVKKSVRIKSHQFESTDPVKYLARDNWIFGIVVHV